MLSDLTLPFDAERRALLLEWGQSTPPPGRVLRDVEVFLEAFRKTPPTLTKNHGLPLKRLKALNSSLSKPLEHGLKRPLQKSLPHVAGVFMLLRVSGLSRIRYEDKEPCLVVDERVYPDWQGLNPQERYAHLLCSWLVRGRSEVLGERGHLFDLPLLNWAQFYPDLAGLRERDRALELERLRYTPGLYNLALLELFGLVEVMHGRPVEGQGWQIDRVTSTPFGDALLACLLEPLRDEDVLTTLIDGPEDEAYKIFRGKLEPYFGTGHLALLERTFTEERHLFKVSLGGAWRQLSVSAEASLDELASAVLGAFSFDNDHLYRFLYRTRYGTTQEVTHPYMEEGTSTDEVRVGEVPLELGERLLFNFDFGDDWYFELVLEGLEAPSQARAKVLERHGEAPEQYPTYDDDWE